MSCNQTEENNYSYAFTTATFVLLQSSVLIKALSKKYCKQFLLSMEKFIVCLKRNGQFQFKLVNEQEQTLLASLSYTLKQTCLNDIEMLRSGFDFTNRFFVTKVAANKFCFALLKSEVELLAVSSEFTSESDCENYIKRMQETVSSMIIDEQIR